MSRDRSDESRSRRKPAPLTAKLYPCRECGKMSANRFYCPEHHAQKSASSGDCEACNLTLAGGMA